MTERYEGLKWLLVLLLVCALIWLIMALPDQGLFVGPPQDSGDLLGALIMEARNNGR